MPFEIFERKSTRYSAPTISVNPQGRIYLNSSATAILRKDAAEFVLLLWDRDRRRLAIRPITKKDKRAFKVAYNIKGTGANLSVKSFLDYIGFTAKDLVTASAEWNEESGMLEGEIPAEALSTDQRVLPIDGARSAVKVAS